QSTLLLPMAGLIDKEAELARLEKEIGKIHGEIARIDGKLSNQAFVAKAPQAVVDVERDKLAGYQDGLVKLLEQQAMVAAL
ncbi:MAG: hypothetical protein ACRCWB_10865, partial [Enterovibrio sp.]